MGSVRATVRSHLCEGSHEHSVHLVSQQNQVSCLQAVRQLLIFTKKGETYALLKGLSDDTQ